MVPNFFRLFDKKWKGDICSRIFDISKAKGIATYNCRLKCVTKISGQFEIPIIS